MQIKNVTATHKKDFRILLENLSFVLEAGDKMAVVLCPGSGRQDGCNRRGRKRKNNFAEADLSAGKDRRIYRV